jgi:hypothetical protein
MRDLSTLGLAFLCIGPSVLAQGTFQNLDFESATLVPPSGGQVQFAPAFPGWIGYIGGTQQTAAVHDLLALDSSAIGIIDSAFSNPYGLPGGLIQGSFTAVLQAGVDPTPSGGHQPADTTLAQTGLIPVGTESLLFRAQLDVSGLSGSFGVSLGGQTLSLVPLQVGANYIVYGADIHAWGGQTAELDFTAFAQRPHIGVNYLYLDSIEFSDQVVPEPGVFGLFALGALLLGWRGLRGRR